MSSICYLWIEVIALDKGRKTDNVTMKIWLETIQQIVGSNKLESLLTCAHLEKYIDNFPPDNDDLDIPLEDLQGLYLSLLELSGVRATTDLQMQLGRENIRAAMEKRPQITKTLQISVQSFSETRKMHFALEKFAEEASKRITSKHTPRIEVKDDGDHFVVIDKDWHESLGIVSTMPVCGVYVGMLQYFMEWITGRRHEVEEIECKAMGCLCDVFRISKAAKAEVQG